jgi:hypothetical protein
MSDMIAPNRPVYTITTPVNDVVTVSMNFEMAEMLRLLIDDVRTHEGKIEPELLSLARALKDPWAAQRIAAEKRNNRFAARNMVHAMRSPENGRPMVDTTGYNW